MTVAVVSWNTRALLAECLRSLRDDSASGLAEVWVVDNASADGSAELVRDHYPWVSLLAADGNLGFGPAVNLVAERTSSPWLAAANADIRITAGALARLVAEGEAHPEAGAIAPRLILPDGQTQRSAYPFPTIPFTIMYLSGAAGASRRLSRHWSLGAELGAQEVPWAVGAFLLIRRSAWDEVGGFDPAQWMYAEDLDLGWRLRRARWSTRYTPDASVYHDESAATVQAWGGERYRRWHASTYAWLARRRGLAFARLIAALNVVGFFARALLLAPAAVCGSRRARQARQDALNAVHAHMIGLRPRSTLTNVR